MDGFPFFEKVWFSPSFAIFQSRKVVKWFKLICSTELVYILTHSKTMSYSEIDVWITKYSRPVISKATRCHLNKTSLMMGCFALKQKVNCCFCSPHFFYHIWNEFSFRREVQMRLPTPIFSKFSTVSVMVIYGNKVNSKCLYTPYMINS